MVMAGLVAIPESEHIGVASSTAIPLLVAMTIAVVQYGASAAFLRQGLLGYPAAALLPLILAFALLEVDADPPAFGIAMASLALAYVGAPPLARYLRHRIPVWEHYRPGNFSLPLYAIGYPMAIAGTIAAGLLAVPEVESVSVETATSIPLIVSLALLTVQYAISAVSLRREAFAYVAAALIPVLVVFTLGRLDVDEPYYGVALAGLGLGYVVGPPLARTAHRREPPWKTYTPNRLTTAFYAIAYPMTIAGMAVAARLALAEPATVDLVTVASVPLLMSMGLALAQYGVSAVALRSEVWLYLTSAMAPLLMVFALAHFEVDPPFYGVALAGLGLAYILLPLVVRRAYTGVPLSKPLKFGRYTFSSYAIGYPLALAGMAAAGALAVTEDGRAFDSIPLIIAMSLSLAQYVASAGILREGRWVYAAAILLPILGGFIVERLDVPPEYYGVAMVALASVYALGPQAVDFAYRRALAVARPFQTNPYTRPQLEVGYGLSVIGIITSAVLDAAAGISALSMAGALYVVSAFGLGRREFLHAEGTAWTAAYVIGLTLTPLEMRHYGLALMGASTLALAAAPLLKMLWQRAGLASAKEAAWHETIQSIRQSPAVAFHALAYAGVAAAVILPWADAGTWQDNPLLMTTLAWASALFAYSIWVFRSPGFLWAALISADLASVAAMWYANPGMTGSDIAIWLTPATYALILCGAWVRRRTATNEVEQGAAATALERMPTWVVWTAPFLTIALAHILASLAVTASDSEAGLIVALAYFAPLIVGSFILQSETTVWGGLALGGLAFAHGMNLASVEVKAGILYGALLAVGVRGAGYLVQRTLEAEGDQGWLQPLKVWQRPLGLGPYLVTAGTLLAAVAFLQSEGDLVSPDSQWLLATMFVAGLNLSIAALAERRVSLAYLASGLIVSAALLEAVHFELEQPLVYVLPVGVCLLALGQLERRRLGWLLTIPLIGTALLLVLGTTALQSWGLLGVEGQEFIFGLALLGESLLVTAWGILQRVRVTFFTGTVSTMVAVLTLILQPLIPAARALDVEPLAAIFGGLGVVLLALAILLERQREVLLERGREWLARIEDWD
jgi:hypothetical protein